MTHTHRACSPKRRKGRKVNNNKLRVIMITEIKREKVVSIFSEGYGKDIFRVYYSDNTTKFMYEPDRVPDYDMDIDFTEEQIEAIKNRPDVYFNTFEEFWVSHTKWGGWYYLSYLNLAEDIKIFIKNEFDKFLSNSNLPPDEIRRIKPRIPK
jgi:hypothetical protein